jgi:hypothetical protein
MVMEMETGKLNVHEAGLVISGCRGDRGCDYRGKWGRDYRQVGDQEYTNRHKELHAITSQTAARCARRTASLVET